MTTTTTTTPQHFLIGKEMNGSIVVDVVEEITPVRKHYVKVKRTIRLKNGVESWKEFLRDENYTPEQELQDWERQQAYLQRKKEQAAKRQQEAQEKALKDEEKKSSKASLIAKSPISKPTKDFLESAMGSFNLEQLLTNQMEEHEFSDKRAYKSMSSIADAQMNPGKNQVNTRKDPLGYRLSAPEPKPRGLQATELHLQKLLEVEVEAEEEEGYHIDKERISEREENQEILTAEKVEAEQLATPKKVTESGRMAAEQLAAEKVAEAEEGRIAAEKPHPEKIPAEKALQAEKLAAEPSAAKSEAEQQLLERKKHEAERLAAEKATAEKIDAERQNAQLFAVEKTERERIAAEITALRKAEAERTAAETKSSTEEGDDKTEDRPDDEQEVYEMKAAVEQLATDTDASELEDQEDPKPSSFKRKKKKRDEKKSTSKERKSKRKSTSRGRKKKTDDGDSSVEEEKSNRKSTSRGRKKKTGDDDSSTEDKKSKRKSTSRGTKKRTEDDDSSVEDEKSKRTSTSRGRKKKIEDSSSSVGSKRKSTSRGKRKTRKGTKKEHTNNENKRVSEVLHPSDPNDSDVSIDADKLFPQQYESSSEHVEHASADMSGSITGSSAILYNSTVSSANLSLSAEVESETIAGPPKSESIHTPAVSGKANLNSDSPGFSKISSPFFPKSPAFSELMGVWVARESKTSVYKTTLDAVQKTGGESPESPTLESMVRKWEAKGAGETTVRKDPPNKLKKTQAPKLPNLDIPFEPPAFQKSVEERKLVEKTVEENRLFKDLTPAGKAPILDAFERKVYKKGETIGEEGEAENCYSIVQSGTVKFHSHGKEVGSAGVGESFGEIGLLYPSARAVTIEAAERHTVLLQLDHAHFRRIVKEEMMRAEKAKLELLKAVPTFKGLDEVELRHLGHAMVALPFKKGENLSKAFRKRAFCLVQQSSIEVKHPRPQPGTSKKPKKVVTALADGLAFTIDHEAFAKVFGNYNRESFKKDDKEILSEVMSVKKTDKGVLSEVKSIKAAKLTEPQIDELLKQISDKRFGEDEEIYALNSNTKPAMYLVRSGKVFIAKSNGAEEIIEPGGYFGHENMKFDWEDATCSLPSSVVAKTSAVAEEETVCGILTLEDVVAIAGRVFECPINIALEDLVRHRILGEGQFGTVWLVTDKNAIDESEPMALKVQDTNDPDGDRPDAATEIKAEIEMMKCLQHPTIVKLYSWYEEINSISMLLNLAPGGELFDIMHQQSESGRGYISGIKEEHAKFYAAGIADALAYMHRKKFVYRDLKPENILIDKDGYPVLTDFGFTKKIEDKTYTYCGTPNYVAPEIITSQGHGLSVDNWSLGVIIYEMVDGDNPFWEDGMDNQTLYNLIVDAPFYPLNEKKYSSSVRDLVSGLLEKNPGLRIGSFREKDILEHEWFSSINIDLMRGKKLEAFWVPDPIELEDGYDSLVG